jgi:hypothetical protein
MSYTRKWEQQEKEGDEDGDRVTWAPNWRVLNYYLQVDRVAIEP